MKSNNILMPEELVAEIYTPRKYLIITINVFFILALIPSILYNFILSGGYIYLALFEIVLLAASIFALYYVSYIKKLKLPAFIDSFIMFGVTIATLLITRGQAFDYALTILLGITVFNLLRLRVAMIFYISGSLFTLFLALFIFESDTQTTYNLFIFIILAGGILYTSNYSQQVVIYNLVKMSHIDSLTGLWNRKKFDEELKREIAMAKRHKLPLTIMIMDVDLFKRVNDTYGHDVGDEYLVELSTFLKNKIRESDFLARWGGEEFSFIFPNTTIDGVTTVATKIKNDLNEKEYKDLGSITMSMGIASYIENEDYDELFHRADEALYLSKENGRNQFTVL